MREGLIPIRGLAVLHEIVMCVPVDLVENHAPSSLGDFDEIVNTLHVHHPPTLRHVGANRDQESAEVLLSPNARNLHVKVRETVLFARLAEGNFPDLDQVIPQAATGRVTPRRKALRRRMLRRALRAPPRPRLRARPRLLRLPARPSQDGVCV